MDIQKIITDIVEKVKNDPDLIKKFLSDPSSVLKGLGIDVPTDQINAVIEGVKSKLDLSNLDVGEAAGGIIGKIKGLFGGSK